MSSDNIIKAIGYHRITTTTRHAARDIAQRPWKSFCGRPIRMRSVAQPVIGNVSCRSCRRVIKNLQKATSTEDAVS